jgi:LPS-assembly lipoprotein
MISALLLLGLQGCGFHLRGEDAPITLPFETLYLNTQEPYSTFSKALREQLQTAKVKIVSEPAQSPLSLVILNDTHTSRDLSVGGNGQTRRIVLAEEVRYELRDPKGRAIGQTHTVQAQRYLTQTQDQILAGSNDEMRLQSDMATACARQVIMQLQSPDTKESLKSLTKKPGSRTTPTAFPG